MSSDLSRRVPRAFGTSSDLPPVDPSVFQRSPNPTKPLRSDFVGSPDLPTRPRNHEGRLAGSPDHAPEPGGRGP